MQSEISERHMLTSTFNIIFIEHQFKRVLKQNFVLFLLDYDHALHIQQLTIERRKIWIPFIKLGVRPTSTPSPKRGQLVSGGRLAGSKRNLNFQGATWHHLITYMSPNLAIWDLRSHFQNSTFPTLKYMMIFGNNFCHSPLTIIWKS
jgi:hypothetical protein